MTLNVAHFCSGGGTTFQNVAQQANAGQLGDIRSSLMVASKLGIGAIEKARSMGIQDVHLQDPKDSQKIIDILDTHNIDVLSCNGWTPRVPQEVIQKLDAQGAIALNQHPASVREDGMDFGGKGMFGSAPTAARILYLLSIGASGDDVFTESTVQHLDPELDRGTSVGVIQLPFESELQEFKNRSGFSDPRQLDTVVYNDSDDTRTQCIGEFVSKVQALLLPLEHENVANVLERIASGETVLKPYDTYSTVLVPAEHTDILAQAKKRAIMMYPKG